MRLQEEMAWENVRSAYLEKSPKLTSSYDFNKAWVAMYDDQPIIFRPSVAAFAEPMTRVPRSPIAAFSDHYDDAVEDGTAADNGTLQACKKIKLTPKQTKTLETSFETDNKLEGERKLQLAKDLGMQPRQVAVWFQNRRARWKTKRLEHDYATLKAKYDAVVEENEQLMLEVEKLAAELQTSNPSKSKLVGSIVLSEPQRMKLESSDQLPSLTTETRILRTKAAKAESSREQSVISTTNSETNYSDVMDEESPREGGSDRTKLEDDRQSNAGTANSRWTDMAMKFGNEEDGDEAIVLKLEEIANCQFSYETSEPYVDMFGAASEHQLWYFNSP